MNIKIREEKATDFEAVFKLIRQAFKSEENSNHQEHFLVERLRQSEAFIPELSLIAEIEKTIVGHILLTKVKITNLQNQVNSLALAPVCVLPKFQHKGIGSMLIKQAHKRAIALGYKSVVLLGHHMYYPKFGYQQAHKFGIRFPFDAPKENCMAIELLPNGLKKVSGTIEYPKEFSQ